MYLVAIAWLYVTVMMAVAEAASPNGSLLGAFFTFMLYGALPLSIVLYILGTPGRKRRLREKALQESQQAQQALAVNSSADVISPDAGSKTATVAEAGGISSVGEKA